MWLDLLLNQTEENKQVSDSTLLGYYYKWVCHNL